MTSKELAKILRVGKQNLEKKRIFLFEMKFFLELGPRVGSNLACGRKKRSSVWKEHFKTYGKWNLLDLIKRILTNLRKGVFLEMEWGCEIITNGLSVFLKKSPIAGMTFHRMLLISIKCTRIEMNCQINSDMHEGRRSEPDVKGVLTKFVKHAYLKVWTRGDVGKIIK